MTLAELADAAQIPARTVRFYIARGLLSGPAKAGRGAEYTAEHLERLQRIRELQAGGTTLAEIARALDGAPAQAPEPSPWWQYVIAADVVVSARADAAPWRAKQIRATVDELARRLRDNEEKE